MSLDHLFLALDNLEKKEIHSFLSNSPKKIRNVKIGLELFLKYGHEIILDLYHTYQVNIFLDLKLHDIPITVSKAIKSLSNLPIHYLTIHLTGGEEMITEALKSAKVNLPNTKILGVSYLTSLSLNDTEDIYGFKLNDYHFNQLFKLAAKTKIDGIICSPHEISLMKDISKDVLIITPGVRFASEISHSNNIGDQKRILSVEETFKLGADFIVMGRSLINCSSVDELKQKLEFIENI